MSKKWYYIEYDTFSLPNEIEAESAADAEQIAIEYLKDAEITIEEMED